MPTPTPRPGKPASHPARKVPRSLAVPPNQKSAVNNLQSTWTPLYDSLVELYGLQTAAVYGAVWRYCQMRDGVCRASLDTIAARLRISRMTVLRYLDILEKAGLIKDLTPDLRHRPHIYTVSSFPPQPDPAVNSPSSELSNYVSSNPSSSHSPITNHSSPSGGISDCDTSEGRGIPGSDTGVSELDTRCNKSIHLGVSDCELSNTSLRDNTEETKEENSSEARRIWSILLTYLSEQLNKADFMTWVYPAQPASWDGQTLTVEVGNDYARRWLEERVKKSVENYLKGICLVPNPSIDFIVKPL